MARKPKCVDCGKPLGQRTPYDGDGARRCVQCEMSLIDSRKGELAELGGADG